VERCLHSMMTGFTLYRFCSSSLSSILEWDQNDKIGIAAASHPAKVLRHVLYRHLFRLAGLFQGAKVTFLRGNWLKSISSCKCCLLEHSTSMQPRDRLTQMSMGGILLAARDWPGVRAPHGREQVRTNHTNPSVFH
jgi:hypothetical protein